MLNDKGHQGQNSSWKVSYLFSCCNKSPNHNTNSIKK